MNTAAHRVEIDSFEPDEDTPEVVVKAFCDCGWSQDHFEHSSDYVRATDTDLRASELRAVRAAKDAARDHAPAVIFEGGLPA